MTAVGELGQAAIRLPALAWPTPQILPSPREGWALGCTPGPALDLCPQPPPSPTHGSPAPRSPVSAPLMEPPIPGQSPWGKPQFGILQRERAPVAPGWRGQLFPPPLGLTRQLGAMAPAPSSCHCAGPSAEDIFPFLFSMLMRITRREERSGTRNTLVTPGLPQTGRQNPQSWAELHPEGQHAACPS